MRAQAEACALIHSAPLPLLRSRAARAENYFFTAVEEVLPLLAADFLVPFLWLFFEVVFAVVFDVLVELCAGGLADEAAVWAAKVNGTAAAVKASARIVFFMVLSPGGPFVLSPAHNSILR